MFEQYSYNDRIVNLAKDIDHYLINLKPNIKRFERKYYISYQYNDVIVLLIWFNKDCIWLYFKDRGIVDVPPNLVYTVPQGVTKGFNKRLGIANKNDFELIKRAIKKYINSLTFLY